MHEAANLTPMFRQYRSHKKEHPDAVLLFRMGDFYEMFYEDAQVASRLLELTLTARGKGTDHVVPMCGFPHHQLDNYTARLVAANHKVAICDQVEDPRKAKGLVRREVVRIVTPGTMNDPSQVDHKSNVWLAGLAAVEGRIGASFLDVSTGEFLAWEVPSNETAAWEAVAERLRSFAPREILRPEGLAVPTALETVLRGTAATEVEPYAFSTSAAAELLSRRFAVASLDGFGLRNRPAAVAAAGGLLQYVQDTQKCDLQHIDRLLYHEPSRHLLLDPATRRNLELDRSLRDGGRAGSLFHTLDATRTAAGGRLFRAWLLAPLLDTAEIGRRHDAVEELVRRADRRAELRGRLEGIHDVERLLSRAVCGLANPRELLALRSSLERVPDLVALGQDLSSPLLRQELDGLDPCRDVAQRLAAGIADEPPISPREGGVIRDGFHAELDRLRSIRRDARAYLAALESKERQTTGISSLKLRFNKVFGYYIEVSRANLALVPQHYERKQTIANGERYVTAELKEHEASILTAEERIEELEVELFQGLRAEVAAEASRIKVVARVAALVDVVAALAELAVVHGYNRPVVDAGTLLHIVGGRHPVVERNVLEGRFVPNDTRLESGGRAIAVLTGPNMGGKSTYLRQVALIVLLAQAGSFVPADAAELGVVDRIFCRVGSSDSLAEGQSTFMIEMSETANILHHATPSSLVLLDEVGRGTSTFDGLSIAWAVVEHLHGTHGGAPRTLFATHYHELTELAVELESVINLRMSVREWGESVVFLHRVEPGAADRSYGIHVARLAGVPPEVVRRAGEILANLERDQYGRDGLPRLARGSGRPAPAQPSLFSLMEPGRPDEPPVAGHLAEVLAELKRQDPERLTPLEALQLLASWRRKLEQDPEA